MVRLVAWNCNMALHKKLPALMALQPDVAVISETANLETLRERGITQFDDTNFVWMGKNKHKGLGILGFNGYRVTRSELFFPTLRYILPVEITGNARFNLLGVWAQNASGGITRKHQLGPLRRASTKYRNFITSRETLIAGDFNNNPIWDRPGWRVNHMTMVEIFANMGLASVYHSYHAEQHGLESIPTHYWRDRRKDGPTYHIDYIYAPQAAVENTSHFQVGSFEDWCGNGLSDHAPLIADIPIITA